MCGIAAICGQNWTLQQLTAMAASLRHRGPDDHGTYRSPSGRAGLAHQRLSIIDLSAAGRQPMSGPDQQQWIVFNGEIYNHVELRRQLSAWPFRSRTDTEVILAAFDRFGDDCLNEFLGMFALIVWDERRQRLVAARDRFGVKPLYYHQRADGTLLLASEIKALHAAGVPEEPDDVAWATYLACGLSDYSSRTFWRGISAVPPGHVLTWQDGRMRIACWYDLAKRIGTEYDQRPLDIVQEEYVRTLRHSLDLRFRSDVPVGINLSGGLDSSTLLQLVQSLQGPESAIKAFTFTTGDARYDELPWVRQMLASTRHPSVESRLRPDDVPDLAQSVQSFQDEPFGGLPTLAYARLFEDARAEGIIVLLDGQGMDEQWAGYDYYRQVDEGPPARLVQGTRERAVRPECLVPEFLHQAEPYELPTDFPDHLRNLQLRDVRVTKIPRALRFNDRISMRVGTELREPFLDHRLFELALRQPQDRKIRGGIQKWLLRRMVRKLLPGSLVEAPKRPLQTPQREWLRGPLRGWATEQIETALSACGDRWLEPHAVRCAWQDFCAGAGDNSFFIWQWISIGLSARQEAATVNA